MNFMRITIKRWVVIAFWAVVLCLLIYFFFFQASVFEHIFQYPGPGSPFVNTLQG